MEKRKTARHRIKNPDQIQLKIGTSLGHIKAFVSDISFSGMMLLFKGEDFPNETSFAENFNVHERIKGIIRMDAAQTRFTFQGLVKWTSKLEETGGYRYGLGVQFDSGSQISQSFMALAISDFQNRLNN